MESRPAMVENCLSSGVATAEAMVSGLAPGRLALTRIVGKSTFGQVAHRQKPVPHYAEEEDRQHDEGRHDRSAYKNFRDVHYLLVFSRCLYFDLCAGNKPELAVGNYLLSRLQSLPDHTFAVQGPGNNHRTGFNRKVVFYDKDIHS